ncbi:hypothetical protein U1Q18_032243 [Sarracenia purpurea var. burkii]
MEIESPLMETLGWSKPYAGNKEGKISNLEKIENRGSHSACNCQAREENLGEGQALDEDPDQAKKEIIGKLKNEDQLTAKEHDIQRKLKKLERTSSLSKREPDSARKNKILVEEEPAFADGADNYFEPRKQSKNMIPDTHPFNGDPLIITAMAVPQPRRVP